MERSTGPLQPSADGPAAAGQTAPTPQPPSSATILAGLFIDHGLSLDWLPAVTAYLPSAAALEQGIRAEYARLSAQAPREAARPVKR